LVGLAVIATSWVGIVAAQRSIGRLKTDWETIYGTDPARRPKLPGLTGGGDHMNHKFGFLAPSVFPGVFVAAWAVLLWFSVRNWWLFGTP
jgi:hypothetical protein